MMLDTLSNIVMMLSAGVTALLMVFALHRLWILFLFFKTHRVDDRLSSIKVEKTLWPRVTVQLPIYNEKYVVERLIDSVCALDYPRERLEIQVLDDSTDETSMLADQKVQAYRAQGFAISHVRRPDRAGYKAGALAYGLAQSRGEFIAIFDADFVPPRDFLKRTLPHFQDLRIGMVQTRWGHLNESNSLLTSLQAMFLDAHFLLEHTARNRTRAFFNFNGTAGVWRKEAIESAGGWQSDTLTEDLDISYRAQLAGWKFLYLPDLVCPAELPADIHAFKTQQHRWTTGAVQTARKVLPAVWRSRYPLHVKTEATFHLAGSICYALLGLLSLLLPLHLFADTTHHLWDWGEAGRWILWGSLLFTFSFYAVSTRMVHRHGYKRLAQMPLLIAFGSGMCWTHCRAIFHGLTDRMKEFRRTAKYAVSSTQPLHRISYGSQPNSHVFCEWAVSAYFLVGLAFAWKVEAWYAMPFLALFLFGNAYVGVLAMTHAAPRKLITGGSQ